VNRGLISWPITLHAKTINYVDHNTTKSGVKFFSTKRLIHVSISKTKLASYKLVPKFKLVTINMVLKKVANISPKIGKGRWN
jgi:hypothetical protein